MQAEIEKLKQKIRKLSSDISLVELAASPSLFDTEAALSLALDDREDFL